MVGEQFSGFTGKTDITPAILIVFEMTKDYRIMLGNGLPIFPDPARAANALFRLAAYAEFRRRVGEES